MHQIVMFSEKLDPYIQCWSNKKRQSLYIITVENATIKSVVVFPQNYMDEYAMIKIIPLVSH